MVLVKLEQWFSENGFPSCQKFTFVSGKMLDLLNFFKFFKDKEEK